MPSNPNVPQDVRELAFKTMAGNLDIASWPRTEKWPGFEAVEEVICRAIMADRASRPSLSTDGDGVVARLQTFASSLRDGEWTSALMAAYNPFAPYQVLYEDAKAALVADLLALSRTPKAEPSEEARENMHKFARVFGEGIPGELLPVDAFPPAPAPQAQSEPVAWTDLARQIEALLALDRRDALTPPLPGLPRELLQRALDAFYGLYASPQPQPVAIKPLRYDQIIAIVDDCSDRMKAAGEGHRMLAKWISEGINAAIATPPAQGDMMLVPREPTDAMIEAGIEALREHTQLVAIDRDPLFVWRYMLHAASPHTPSEER